MEIAICFRPISGDGVNFRRRRSKGFNEIHYYYENICIAFTSIRLLHPSIDLVLLTTERVPKLFNEILKSLSVKIRIIGVTFTVEEGFAKNYIGSLFILDCIYSQEVDTLYIDPDTICLSNIDSILSGNENILVYDTLDKPECQAGISLITRFIQDNFQDRSALNAYYGGEFYYLPADSVPAIKGKILLLWELNNQAFREGMPYLTTEEHFLSVILNDFSNIQKTNMIQRIWTTRRYRTIPNDLKSLAFLHLPAEKDQGLSQLFNLIYSDVQNPNVGYLTSRYRRKLYRTLHIKIGLTKKLQYLLIQAGLYMSKILKR
jgi:hypothetical protein